jgi:hypothetical protein
MTMLDQPPARWQPRPRAYATPLALAQRLDPAVRRTKALNLIDSLVLSFVTLGIYGLIAEYKVMKFWWEIQVTEQDICERLSTIWTRLGIVQYPISFEPIQKPLPLTSGCLLPLWEI